MYPVNATIDLRPGKYQSSLNAFRTELENTESAAPFLIIAVRTPADELVYAQVRRKNAYLVAFRGQNGWYSFRGEDDALGKPCGIGSNYSELGKVGAVTYDDLKSLGELGRFQPGSKLDKRLVAILIAVTAEAARFAMVSTWFTGLTNSVGTAHSAWLQGSVDFEYLKWAYFNRWEKPTETARLGILLPHKPALM